MWTAGKKWRICVISGGIPEEIYRIEERDTISRYHLACVWDDIAGYFAAVLYQKWQELLNRDEEEKVKKIVCTDEKTMCGNKRKDSWPSYIVSAWCREDGFCLGQCAVGEKSNEITAIPDLLDKIQIKGQVVTIDAIPRCFVVPL